MAKELPYFQFEPAEYLTRDISFCSLSAQGLFINVCAYYWQRNCELTKSQLLRRLDYETELNELIKEGVIDLEGEEISIKFLDLQLMKVEAKSSKNSENGKKGGRPKKAKLNPNESETKANQKPSESETKGIREDKIKENEIIEDKSNEKSKRFSAPSLSDVKSYCIERGNKIEPQKFINYYESIGWKVGKNQMKDWKAAIRNWESRDKAEVKPEADRKKYKVITDGNPNYMFWTDQEHKEWIAKHNQTNYHYVKLIEE